ncbi:MAG: hypothetical protein ACI82A_002662 [Candidatus Azotimanducaceae bacterium]|jgi:hypothetical protein
MVEFETKYYGIHEVSGAMRAVCKFYSDPDLLTPIYSLPDSLRFDLHNQRDLTSFSKISRRTILAPRL